MALTNDGLDSDLAAMIDDLPASLIYAGRTYEVTASEVTRGKRLDMEGMLDTADMTVVAFAEDFPVRPRENATCTLDGVGYRIDRVQESPDGAAYTLSLGAL
jgi:hypothetical protein